MRHPAELLTMHWCLLETLPADMLVLAETLATRAENGQNLRLREAIEDYRDACRQLQSGKLSRDDRRHWQEIRGELVAEVTRLTLQLSPPDTATRDMR